MIDRRTFHRLLGGVLCALTIGVRAQPANRAYRVGVLRPTPAPPTLDPVSAEVVMSKAFARMGHLEGRNFHLDQRYADGDPQRLPALARDLVQQRVDVIVAVSPAAVRAAHHRPGSGGSGGRPPPNGLLIAAARTSIVNFMALVLPHLACTALASSNPW